MIVIHSVRADTDGTTAQLWYDNRRSGTPQKDGCHESARPPSGWVQVQLYNRRYRVGGAWRPSSLQAKVWGCVERTDINKKTLNNSRDCRHDHSDSMFVSGNVDPRKSRGKSRLCRRSDQDDSSTKPKIQNFLGLNSSSFLKKKKKMRKTLPHHFVSILVRTITACCIS